ncbi:hypothetical protein [Salinivibrio kushneri]|uniref:hypothetical protein n=1 Tax=Salinivibrio kushneri TaxID=1908198 RepID=UPI000988FED9|nr:hypothetical protein [Salinivibrio kushneri]OOE64668.1 hypothetical protein BZG19_14490 [Salinivibrio kushneri]
MKLWKLECVLVIAAIFLCVRWLTNSEENLEPFLVLISFIVLLVGVWRRKSSSLENKESIEGTELSSNFSARSEKYSVEVESSNLSKINDVFEDVVAGLNVGKYTKLQVDNFVERNSGKKIELRIRVSNIEPMFKSIDSKLILIFTVPQPLHSSSLPNFYSAIFDRKYEKDLSALSAGDIATISGELGFSNLVGDYSVSIENAQLISFKKA